MENPGDWETDEAVEIAWLTEAFDRIAADLTCSAEYWQQAIAADARAAEDTYDSSMYSLVKHFENVIVGVGILHTTFVNRFCRPEIVGQLAVDKMQEQTGQPVRFIGSAVDDKGNAGFLFELENVVVPDDLEGLDGLDGE